MSAGWPAQIDSQRLQSTWFHFARHVTSRHAI